MTEGPRLPQGPKAEPRPVDLDPERFARRAQEAADRVWRDLHPGEEPAWPVRAPASMVEEVPEDPPRPEWCETPLDAVLPRISPEPRVEHDPRSRRAGRVRVISPEARVRMQEGARKAAAARKGSPYVPRETPDPSSQGVRPEGSGLDGPEYLPVKDPGCDRCAHQPVCALVPLIPKQIGVEKLDRAFHLSAVIVLDCSHWLAK